LSSENVCIFIDQIHTEAEYLTRCIGALNQHEINFDSIFQLFFNSYFMIMNCFHHMYITSGETSPSTQ